MDTRALSFLFQAGPIESTSVTELRVERRLGRYSEAEVEIRTSTYAEPDDLLGLPARLAFGRGEADHELLGVVMSVVMVSSPEDDSRAHLCYRIQVTSVLGLLEGQVDCRIFQGKDVKEIVSEVLRDLGVADKSQSWRLSGTYPKREHCVQYDESALSFVSRLLEEEGIFFFSVKGDAGEIVVFEDDSTMGDPVDGDKKIAYRHGAGLNASDDSVSVITQRHRISTGKITFRDYDFKKPELDLTAAATAVEDADLEVYDYPGHYIEAKEGKRLAQVRLESLQAERVVLELESGCPRLIAGRWIELIETPNELDGEYLITGAVHEMKMGVYRVHATVIPRKIKFRTPQRTPAPIIDGPQTATVVAPPGSQSQEIHTDKHGRCKVQFHWDRYSKRDDTASCWMRISQQQTSGSMILPRVGWEVIVEFLEGNPDRPLVTGRVFNGKFMPPYALPEGKSRTSLQSASSPGGKGANEIWMEDRAGSEEVKIASHKDTTLATGNNKTTSIAANQTKAVKVNSTIVVGADQTVKVTNGYLNTVKAAQTATVSGDRTVEVNAVYGLTSLGDSLTVVSGNQFEMDGDPIKALLALALKAATEAAEAEGEKQMQKLDQVISDKVDQMMGPIKELEEKAKKIGAQMEAISKGDLRAMAGAVTEVTGMPMPREVGYAIQVATAVGVGDGGPTKATGDWLGLPEVPSLHDASHQVGLDSLVNGAIQGGADKLGAALGLDGGGGGGSSLANKGGPDGAEGGNTASDSATGPGHAINVCSATHDEKVGAVKATIAAAGIHTTINGARTHTIGAARAELIAGDRTESCRANKTEEAFGLVVYSPAAESETVGGTRTTMVGGAILEKIGGSHTVIATGKAMFVGAYHKFDAKTSIVFKCGDSEVVIDGGGITIKSALVTFTAPKVTLSKSVSEA